MDEGDGAGRYWDGMCMIPFRNLQSRIRYKYLLCFSSGELQISYAIPVALPPWRI